MCVYDWQSYIACCSPSQVSCCGFLLPVPWAFPPTHQTPARAKYLTDFRAKLLRYILFQEFLPNRHVHIVQNKVCCNAMLHHIYMCSVLGPIFLEPSVHCVYCSFKLVLDFGLLNAYDVPALCKPFQMCIWRVSTKHLHWCKCTVQHVQHSL